MRDESIEAAAQQFDTWMKKFKGSHQAYGTWTDHNKALHEFLICDQGFRLIKTFDAFRQLFSAAKKLGYNTTWPSLKQYNDKVKEADPNSYGDVKPETEHQVTLRPSLRLRTRKGIPRKSTTGFFIPAEDEPSTVHGAPFFSGKP